jgi:hypothetical protein
VFDPWQVAHRIRWLERQEGKTPVERPAPKVDRFLDFQTSARHVSLFDAFDESGLLLAHAQVEPAPEPQFAAPTGMQPTATRAVPRWAHWVLGVGATVASLVGAIMWGLSFLVPASVPTQAGDINALNERRRSLAAAGVWSLSFGVATGLVAIFVGGM